MDSYNDNLYDLVLGYLNDNNITDFSKFSLSNSGEGDSIISKWGYKIPVPTKDLLFRSNKIDKIKDKKDREEAKQCYLNLMIVDKPDFEQNNCIFIYKGEFHAIANGKLKKIMFEDV